MAGDIVVNVRAGTVLFGLIASFARVPAPGEHILLWLTDEQRAKIGPEFGYGKTNCVPAIVRQTLLRSKDQWTRNLPSPWTKTVALEEHVADLFVEATPTDGWEATMSRWAGGEPL